MVILRLSVRTVTFLVSITSDMYTTPFPYIPFGDRDMEVKLNRYLDFDEIFSDKFLLFFLVRKGAKREREITYYTRTQGKGPLGSKVS